MINTQRRFGKREKSRTSTSAIESYMPSLIRGLSKKEKLAHAKPCVAWECACTTMCACVRECVRPCKHVGDKYVPSKSISDVVLIIITFSTCFD